jgi:hypothetical protein
MPMSFKQATDKLGERVTAADIAAQFGAHPNTIARARLERASPAYRSPPEGWERVLARLAREKAADLTRLAEELERE